MANLPKHDLIQRPPNGRRANGLTQTIYHPAPGQTVTIGGVDYYADKNGTMRRVKILTLATRPVLGSEVAGKGKS